MEIIICKQLWIIMAISKKNVWSIAHPDGFDVGAYVGAGVGT